MKGRRENAVPHSIGIRNHIKEGIVDDIYHDEEEEEGVLSLLLIWKEVNGLKVFHEQEIQQIRKVLK